MLFPPELPSTVQKRRRSDYAITWSKGNAEEGMMLSISATTLSTKPGMVMLAA
jgi:hypothetical protein